MDFPENLSKATGHYRCPDNINNLKIRVRIRDEETVKSKKPFKYKSKVFFWQKKHFSKEQKEFYADSRNCFTEQEKSFHNLLSEQEIEENDDNFLFTYCNEENYCTETKLEMNYLEMALNNTNINANFDKWEENEEYDLTTNVQKSMKNPVLAQNVLENMHIMADFGNYFDDVWIKNEKPLCQITYNRANRTLQIYPDFTNFQPYIITVANGEGTEKMFSYFIENASDKMPDSMAFNEQNLIKKLRDCKSSITKPKDEFKIAPKNGMYFFVFLEIIMATLFDECEEMSVEYSIECHPGWRIVDKESFNGKTQISKLKNGSGYFGHCLEICFEYNLLIKIEYSKFPSIYFEIISKDSWNRQRTEGLTYLNLPMYQTGSFQHDLSCFRLTSRGPLNELRRFFIGDCRNYEDVKWIGIPHDHKDMSLNKFGIETISTGQLKVRLNIVHQSQRLDREKRKSIFDRLGSSTLIKSVEQVIRQFKTARQEMLEARKNI